MKRLPSRRLAAALAAVLLAGTAAGTAAAEPVSLTQRHDCAFPLLGMKPLPVVLETDIPNYAAVGETIPGRTVAARVRFDGDLTTGLALADIETISGFLAVRVTVDKPDGDQTFDLPVTFRQRMVPSIGPFDLDGYAVLPAVAFTAPGRPASTRGRRACGCTCGPPAVSATST
ncbi:DUF6801 domain-containing protein [Actinokineospora soli]|uniref:DUF6801 domain-containing protein n=1 Tax=Actinokineospora soli TaxID=1048753 RepID=A0ABW2TJE6_9PSEU